MADAAPAVAPAAAWSQSANIAITSNYIWRGVSQNLNSLAVQGGFDVAHTSGLSAGVWASSVQQGSSSIELDAYANYGFKVAGIDASVGYIAYTYQGNSSLDFSEVNVAATYAGVTAKISKEITNAAAGTGFADFGYYYELGYTYSVPAVKGLDLGLHYGWADSNNNTTETGTDYSVSLTYPVAGFAATVAYSNGGTDNLGADVKKLYSLTLKKTF